MSVFNCNISYKKIDGDSYQSTYNRLVSQGLIDKYNNIIDIPKFYKANTELSDYASSKLGMNVRLYTTPMRPKGRVAVPNMKVFGMLDSKPKPILENIVTEELPEAKILPIPYINQLYEIVGKSKNSLLTNEDVALIEDKIKEFNEASETQNLKVVETNILGFNLINIEYKANYLYNEMEYEMNEETYVPQSDNSDFNKKCIIG